MAATNFTPLSLYYSATASNTPLAANLVAGELALNTADGKLFYKDSSGNVQVLASKAGNVNVSSFSAGTTGLTPSTATTGAVTLAGTLAQANGGTGFGTYTTGDTLYASASNTLSKLAVGTNGQILRVVSGVPAWGTDYVGTVTSVSGTGTVNGLTLTGTVTSSGSLTLGGTLDLSSPPAIGGTSASTGKFTSLTDTGLTSGRVTYATTGGLLTDSANLTFNGTTFTTANDASISGLTVGKGGGSVAANTAVGSSALTSTTTGNWNTAVGYQASYLNTTGENNVAVGRLAMYSNTTGVTNTAVGVNALYSNTTASNNTASGTNALYANTTGASNTAVGSSALNSNTTASNNTAVGYQAAYANTTGDTLTAVGRIALKNNTTGYNSTALGAAAATNSTTGNYLTAIGDSALNNNTTGSQNIAVGSSALYSNTTASNNTAVGYQAGYSNAQGSANTFIGYQSGFTANYGSTANTFNTCVGYQSGYSLTSGYSNTFIGPNSSGYAITTGQNHTIIGNFTGNQGGLDIRTTTGSSGYIVLSDGAGNPRQVIDSSGKLFINRTTSGDGSGVAAAQVQILMSSTNDTMFVENSNASDPYGINVKYSGASPNGTGNNFLYCADTTTSRMYVRSNGGISNYSANNTNLSDQREKKNIELSGSYLDKICAIPVKTFLYNDQTDTDLNLGVIAQDVQAVAPELVMESNWANKEEDPKMRLSIYQTDLQYALMKAIQELNAKVDAQAVEIATLKAK